MDMRYFVYNMNSAKCFYVIIQISQTLLTKAFIYLPTLFFSCVQYKFYAVLPVSYVWNFRFMFYLSCYRNVYSIYEKLYHPKSDFYNFEIIFAGCI